MNQGIVLCEGGPDAGNGPLHRIARRKGSRIQDPAVDAEDVAHDALIKLARSSLYLDGAGQVDWSRIQTDSEDPAIANRLVTQVLVDLHRKTTAQRRGSGQLVASLDAPAPGAEADGTLEEIVAAQPGRPVEDEALWRTIRDTVLESLEHALDGALSWREQKVMAAALQGRKPVEIAAELGLQIDNVNVILSRARRRLRRLLPIVTPVEPGD